MENKKAILLPEFLMFILAVIVIVLLVFLAFQLFSIFMRKTELEQAKSTLNALVGKIEGLEEGESVKYLVTAPKGWYIVAYSDGEKMPKECKEKNCLCICPTEKRAIEDVPIKLEVQTGSFALDYFYNEGLEKCEKEGACSNVEGNVKINRFQIVGDNWNDYAKEVNWISLFSLPKNIYLEKSGGEAILSESLFVNENIINNLLSREITFNKQKITFETFVRISVYNKCFFSGDKKIEIDNNARNKLKEETGKYLDELIANKKLKGGLMVFWALENSQEKEKIEIDKTYSGCSYLLTPTESKEICSNDFEVYITLQVCE